MVTINVPRTWRSVIVCFCKYKLNTLSSLRFSSRKLVKTNVVCVGIIPRDAPEGHRRGNNPVEYVFFVIFIFVTRSRKKQCRILIEV